MLHVALLCLFVGQVPPPPVPHPPEGYEQSQREWLLDHLLADLRAQGKLDAQKGGGSRANGEQRQRQPSCGASPVLPAAACPSPSQPSPSASLP